MSVDIGMLKVDGAIFHQVPVQNALDAQGQVQTPTLSTVESNLDSRLEFFLRDRLTRTFSQAAQPVVRDEDIDTPVPALVMAALEAGSNADIVRPFHPLPALLLDVQAHNSPQGLLAVIRGSCGNVRVLVLVKVEQERGLSFETFNEDGQIRVEVVIEDGLVLTDKTEVFKACLFYLEDEDLAGVITDDQTGTIFRGPSSLYWLQDFLGCQYERTTDVQTRLWVKGTERLVKSDLKEPAEQDAVLSAMLVELRSNQNEIDPNRFIEDHVPSEAQDAALTRLRNEGAPTTRFPKSHDVGDNAPTKKRFSFDSGYEVTMPADETPDLRREVVDGSEVDVLTIRGRIRRVGT